MSRRRFFSLALVFGLLIPLAATTLSSRGANAAPTAMFAVPQFEQVWARTDGPVANAAVSRSWIWGPQPGEVRNEPFSGAPGGMRTVQYFDKARMEVNPDADPNSQWATTTGLLVVEMVSGRVQTGPTTYDKRAPADLPVAGDAGGSEAPLYSSFRDVASLPGGPEHRVSAATGASVTATIDRTGSVGSLATSDVRYAGYSQETGHNIPDVFARFVQTRDLVSENGALQQGQLLDPTYVLGYPITEAYWAMVPVDGKATRVLVQLYQRRVLTYIPGFSPAWQVQMGNVGLHYYSWRYAPIPTPVPSPTARPGANDAFLHISGSEFFYGGQPVTLKGTNYWNHLYNGVNTWADWDGPTVQQELEKAHQLGVNTIRIGIPYDTPMGLDVVWGRGCEVITECTEVKGQLVNRMTQLLQIASTYNMKVIFTLFDWSDLFPQPGTAEYARQLTYLRAVVGPFVDDDRVIGWDLHNEPENYATWRDTGYNIVIPWIANIAGVVRGIDPRHPLTVGVGTFGTLWLEGGGKRLIDVVDFASFHSYEAGELSSQIAQMKANTSKPILLEEMGWPSGPASLSRPATVYDEPTQQFLYRAMLKDAKSNGIAGVIQWTLQDNPLGTPHHYIKPNIQSWFGLVRLDGSFKPAAADFRDGYTVVPLPSRSTSTLPLTVQEQQQEVGSVAK